MRMKLPVILAGLVGIIVLGCSNIDATVEARVAQERAIDATVEARTKELMIASLLFSTDGGNSQTGDADGYVSGVGVEVDIEGSTHVNEGETVIYATSPPASGNHWPVPAPCGFYDEPIPDERIVHNMEHGNIVISYNLPMESDVSALRDALNDIGLNPVWGVARPYSGIEPGHVVLSTWGVTDSFLGVDADRIDTFFETYTGVMGPERVPC
jgi:hypothetical protein